MGGEREMGEGLGGEGRAGGKVGEGGRERDWRDA